MMTHRNRYRPERRSGASTRFARMDLSNQETGGFEPLLFKPPPNGRWCTVRAQWPPGRGMGISPPTIVGRCDASTTCAIDFVTHRWATKLVALREVRRPRESIAYLKVTFSRGCAERKVTFIKARESIAVEWIDPAWRRPRESIQNRSGPVGRGMPYDVGRVSDPTTNASMKLLHWWTTRLVVLQDIRPRESIACLKVIFSRGHVEKKVTFIKAQRRRPRESIQNRSGPIGRGMPYDVGRVSDPTTNASMKLLHWWTTKLVVLQDIRPRESIAWKNVTFSRSYAEKKVTFIRGIDPPWRRPRECIRVRSGSHDVDIGCRGRQRTPRGLARASDGSTLSDRDVGQPAELAFALNFRADGSDPGHCPRPREPVRENNRPQRPPGVGRSGEHGPRNRVWVRCVGESGSRGRGVSMRERVLKTRRAGVLYPC